MSTARSTDAEKTAQAVHAAAIQLLRKLRRGDAATGLNAPRLSALSVIVFGGPLTLGQLAAAEQVRPPTMTRIVHALVGRGLVRKSASAEDRRKVQLSATTKGKRAMLAARGRRMVALTRGIGKLPVREQKTLQDAAGILDGLIRSW
jgi:DNA-binding MarR family transcriptional regulator